MSSIGCGEIKQKISITNNFQLNEGELAITGPPHFQIDDSEYDVIPPEVEDWFTARRESLHEISELIERNELRDATAIVDLAFWKARIDAAEAEGENAADPEVREARRVEVPGPAREAIVSYLIALTAINASAD